MDNRTLVMLFGIALLVALRRVFHGPAQPMSHDTADLLRSLAWLGGYIVFVIIVIVILINGPR